MIFAVSKLSHCLAHRARRDPPTLDFLRCRVPVKNLIHSERDYFAGSGLGLKNIRHPSDNSYPHLFSQSKVVETG